METGVFMFIYIVQPGDTVSRISQDTGTAPELIMYMNQITYPYLLAVGQALLLPGEESASPFALRAGAAGQMGATGTTAAPGVDGRRSVTMNGYAYPFINDAVLNETLPYLTTLSVFSYGFTPSGELIPPLTNDDRMIQAALASGTRPILTLTPLNAEGGFDNTLVTILVHSPQVQENLIQNLIEVMEQKNFSGVDVDFEYILASDRDAFTAFVAGLTTRMNAEGYTVSVALAPKTSDDQPGLLYEGKDYAGLGAAANSVLLMTYEWGYTYSPPMAVAPINQVRRVVEYALTRIPAEKIDLGIPNYGYDWTLPFAEGISRARTIGNVEAAQLAAENGAEIFFDETAQSPYFFYSDNGVEHEVWFEDVRSMQARFDLMEEFALRGAGYWQIMRLFRANWILAEENFRIIR